MRRIASIWRDEIAASELNATARAVACALATYMDRDGVCWPSVETISRLLRLSRRTVQRAIRTLEAQGFLRVQLGGGRGKASTYRATPSDALSDEQNKTKGVSSDTKGRHWKPQTASPSDTRSYEVTEAASRDRLDGVALPLDDCMVCGERRPLFEFGDRLVCRGCVLGESGALEDELRAVVVELREKTC